MDAAQGITASTPGEVRVVPNVRLDYIDHFRGIAIMMVVAVHTGNAVLQHGMGIDFGSFNTSKEIVDILFYNATFYFAFISGCLYSYRLRLKPYASFMKSRILNVWVPYALISLALSGGLMLLGMARSGSIALPPGAGQEILLNILLGEAWNTLWYIPVIMAIYPFSPIIWKIISDKRLSFLAIGILLLPFFFPRNLSEVTFSMIVYFFSVYTMGAVIGANIETFLGRLTRFWPILLLAIIVLSGAIFSFDSDAPIPFSPEHHQIREGLIYLQRTSISLLLLVVLRHWNGGTAPWLKSWLGLMAAYAFGIYFVHGPLLRPLSRFTGNIASALPNADTGIVTGLTIALTFVLALLFSVATVAVVKKLGGRYSQYIIGS